MFLIIEVNTILPLNNMELKSLIFPEGAQTNTPTSYLKPAGTQDARFFLLRDRDRNC